MKRFLPLLIFCLCSCTSPWLKRGYESLGYVRLSLKAASPRTEACVDAAATFASFAQLVLEHRAADEPFSCSESTQNQTLLAEQAYLLMHQHCLEFGTPQDAMQVGLKAKENTRVQSN